MLYHGNILTIIWDKDENRYTLHEAPKEPFSMFFRIPDWCNDAKILVNGKAHQAKLVSATYAEIKGNRKSGDKIEIVLHMQPRASDMSVWLPLAR